MSNSFIEQNKVAFWGEHYSKMISDIINYTWEITTPEWIRFELEVEWLLEENN